MRPQLFGSAPLRTESARKNFFPVAGTAGNRHMPNENAAYRVSSQCLSSALYERSLGICTRMSVFWAQDPPELWSVRPQRFGFVPLGSETARTKSVSVASDASNRHMHTENAAYCVPGKCLSSTLYETTMGICTCRSVFWAQSPPVRWSTLLPSRMRWTTQQLTRALPVLRRQEYPFGDECVSSLQRATMDKVSRDVVVKLPLLSEIRWTSRCLEKIRSRTS